MKKVVTVGGGTGSFVVLQALRKIEDIEISALLTTADDGGIAKKERDEFGILPQSDIRKALVALADTNKNKTLRQLFTYRFSKGLGFEGATLGNLILLALSEIKGSQYAAIKEIEKILNIQGNVIPTTIDNTNLLITLEDGKEIFGETNLDTVFWDGTKRIKNIQLIPRATIFKDAKKALEQAEYIIINPGDLYGSVICNFVVSGFDKTIKKSKAKIVFICNLVTKYGQAYKYNVEDFVTDIEKYLGKKIDILILNNGKFTTEQLVSYAKEKSEPVTYNLKNLNKYKIYTTNLISQDIPTKAKGDKLERSLVRHNSQALYEVLKKVLEEN